MFEDELGPTFIQHTDMSKDELGPPQAPGDRHLLKGWDSALINDRHLCNIQKCLKTFIHLGGYQPIPVFISPLQQNIQILSIYIYHCLEAVMHEINILWKCHVQTMWLRHVRDDLLKLFGPKTAY